MSPIAIAIIIATFLSAIGNALLAWFVYAQGREKEQNRAFAAFALAIGGWSFISGLMLVFQNKELLRLTYATGSYLPLAALIFSFRFFRGGVPGWIKYGLFGAISIFAVSAFTPYLIRNIYEITPTGFSAEYGILFLPWAVLEGVQIFALVGKLVYGYATSSGHRRTQAGYLALAIGSVGLWAALASMILPAFGISALINTDEPAMLVMTAVVSYAIVKHRLLDVRVLITRAVTSSAIIGATAGGIVALIFVGAWFFAQLGVSGVVLISLVVAAATFFVGRLFFRERRAFERRTQELEETKEELEEAKQVLEIKVRARTRELQEVNERLEEKVQQKTQELQERVKELERLHRLTVGRELKMVELKKKIKKLKQELATARGTSPDDITVDTEDVEEPVTEHM